MKKFEEICRNKSERFIKLLEEKSFCNYLLFIEKELMDALLNHDGYFSNKELKLIFKQTLKCFFKNSLPLVEDPDINRVILLNMGMLAKCINYFCPNYDIESVYYQTALVFERCLSKKFDKEVKFKRLKSKKIIKSFRIIQEAYTGF